jgi:hypothetical protein
VPVLGQLARQPPRSRFRADEDEQPGYSQLRRFRLACPAEPHGLEMVSSSQALTWVEGQTTMPGLRSIRSTR